MQLLFRSSTLSWRLTLVMHDEAASPQWCSPSCGIRTCNLLVVGVESEDNGGISMPSPSLFCSNCHLLVPLFFDRSLLPLFLQEQFGFENIRHACMHAHTHTHAHTLAHYLHTHSHAHRRTLIDTHSYARTHTLCVCTSFLPYYQRFYACS